MKKILFLVATIAFILPTFAQRQDQLIIMRLTQEALESSGFAEVTVDIDGYGLADAFG